MINKDREFRVIKVSEHSYHIEAKGKCSWYRDESGAIGEEIAVKLASVFLPLILVSCFIHLGLIAPIGLIGIISGCRMHYNRVGKYKDTTYGRFLGSMLKATKRIEEITSPEFDFELYQEVVATCKREPLKTLDSREKELLSILDKDSIEKIENANHMAEWRVHQVLTKEQTLELMKQLKMNIDEVKLIGFDAEGRSVLRVVTRPSEQVHVPALQHL
jgi:hypothetical protein